MTDRLPAPASDRKDRGQSVVEFALILPVVALMLLGILDLSRVFTSIMTIESAAREAADYGAWQSGNWSGDPGDPDSARYKTEAGMRGRACIASRSLIDFVGSGTVCANPAISIELLDERGDPALAPNGTLLTDCDQAVRSVGAPCKVKVDLTYTFDLIIPLGFDAGGHRFGLPQDVTFTRTSIFAISDFSVDQT